MMNTMNYLVQAKLQSVRLETDHQLKLQKLEVRKLQSLYQVARSPHTYCHWHCSSPGDGERIEGENSRDGDPRNETADSSSCRGQATGHRDSRITPRSDGG